MFKDMDSKLTGQNAEAVLFRDKITGNDYSALVILSCSETA